MYLPLIYLLALSAAATFGLSLTVVFYVAYFLACLASDRFLTQAPKGSPTRV